MSTLAAVTLPQMDQVTPQRVTLEFESLVTQRLVVEIADGEGAGRWVFLDYRSPGMTTLRVLTLTDGDEDLGSPWDAVDAGRGTVIALGRTVDADSTDERPGLVDLEVTEPIGQDAAEETALVTAAVVGLAEMRSRDDIVPGAALAALQLQDLLANRLTGGNWSTIIDGEVIEGPQTLIEAMMENDLLDGDREDNRGIVEDAYQEGGYDSMGFVIRHSIGD